MNKIVKTLLLGCVSLTAVQAQSKDDMEKTFVMSLSKTINVPLGNVWHAWSDSSLIKQWWGPEGFTAPLAEVNFSEGGASVVCMRSQDGFEIYNSWTYTRILPMYSIEFVQHFVDRERNKLNPASIGLPPGIPDGVPHLIRFEDLGNENTRITVTETGYSSQQTVEISRIGMQQCLDKMEGLLVKQNSEHSGNAVNKQITLNSSSEKVWDVITNPEKIKHWFSGANAESEWKEGSLVSFSGEWNGNEYEDKGIIMQVIPQKIIQFSYWSTFSGLPDKPENYSIVTFRIEGKGNTTILALSQTNFAASSMYEYLDKNWEASLSIIKLLSEE